MTSRSLIVRVLLLLLIVGVGLCAFAQTIKHATHMVPSGKGWGAETDNAPAEMTPSSVVTGNGISYHGGPIMPGTVNVYFIWYGNWTNGAHASDSQTSVNLLSALFGSNGLNNSGYEKINATYGDNSANVSGNLVHSTSTTDNYSRGSRLRDSDIKAIVAAHAGKDLPYDPSGLYFVLTSSDVNETSGFCTKYCGWHTHATIGSGDVKYSFVGNPDRCPNSCEAQTTSPNNDAGADGMASVMAHESEEAISDPDLNAWYDSSGAENADKCAWKWGPTKSAANGAKYNQNLGGYNWLIQLNWENASGGGCAQTSGGSFYSN